MSECVLSIVVPIYNQNSFLNDCLDALGRQMLSSYEVLLVDDGSDAKTALYLDQFALKYEQFRVIHSENQGVWRARMLGISHARGKWIGFCDSDDFVSNDMYRSMVEIGEKTASEIVVTGYSRVQAGNKKVVSTEMADWGMEYLDCEENIGVLSVINTALWNKIYRAELLRDVIAFDKPPKIAEDMMFLLSIYPMVKRVAFTDRVSYSYMVHDSSAMQNVSEQDCNNTIEAMRQVKAYMRERKVSWQWMELCDVMAMIHLGVSLPISIYGNKEPWVKEMCTRLKKEIDEDYALWRKASMLKRSYICKHSSRLYKVKLIQMVYRSGLFSLFLMLYTGLSRVFGKTIKW